MANTKIKIKAVDGKHQVLALVRHPMHTGSVKDAASGELIPAHFIKVMTFKLNDEVVAQANLGQGVSKNPLIGIEVAGAKAGDKISVDWEDNIGESGNAEDVVD